MGVGYNPKIVTDGLVLALDAGNANKSARGFKNLLDLSTWTLGTGSVTGFSAIGTAGQNEDRRILDTGPFGVSALVWDTPTNDATSDADGGWNSGNVSIDNTKMYRFSVWMRRKIIGNGSFYLGCAGGVLNRSDNVLNNNPYFTASSWPTASFPANSWMLIVGHIWPANSGTGAVHVDTGLYNTSGTKISAISDFVWQTSSTSTYHRSYLYYSTDTTTNQQWYQPRIDLCDGTEPTIAELIAGVGSRWYNLVGTNNGSILNSAALYNSAGYMNFDGVDDHCYIPSFPRFAANSDLTIETFVKPTALNSYSVILARGYGSATYPKYQLLRTNGAGWQFLVGDSVANFSATDSNLVTLNTWQHVVGVLNRSENLCKVYVNGILKSTGSASGLGSFENAAGELTIARAINDLSYSYFVGNIGLIKMYSKALTTEEINQNFNALRGRYGV